MLRSVKTGFIILVLILLFTLYFYPSMPERIAIHWNIEGKPNGYAPREIGLMLIPSILFLILLLFEAIPRIDPLSRNIKKFMKFYESFVVVFALFMAFVQLLVVLWNEGYAFNMGSLITGVLGLILIYLGVVLPHLKRNWFVGIRTPWTLSSEVVWEKTHRLGGRLFVGAGVVSLLSSVFFSKAVLVTIILVVLVNVAVVVYSYLLWRKEKT